MDDQKLLGRYCDNADNDAFAELVHRHLGLVFSAALRQLGDSALAEDAAQIVFTRLAQHAHRLPRNIVLAGWLHATTRLTALQLLRNELRRRTRETEAFQMQEINSSPQTDWAKIRPMLDEALEKLGRTDRDVLLLRFFEQRSLRDTGAALGLGEDAARMRVSRSLLKLREFFQARGISATGAALSAALTTYGVQAAPPTLATSIVASALAAGTPTAGTILGLLTMSKAKLAVIGTICAVGIATPIVWEQNVNGSLREQNRALQAEIEQLRQSAEKTEERLQAVTAEAIGLRNQGKELAQLRGALAKLRQKQMPARPSNSSTPGSAPSARPEPQDAAVTNPDIAAFLERPKGEQGEVLGQLRRQMMTPGGPSRPEFARDHALATRVRPQLEELESRPEEFADFQSAFIKTVIGLKDDEKVGQIRQLVQKTYEQAVAEKLDSKSRPQEGLEAWALRRDELDRRATHAVQGLLSNEERARFDRAFLGIMGIDLGLNDGATHRFVKPDGTIVFPSEEQGH